MWRSRWRAKRRALSTVSVPGRSRSRSRRQCLPYSRNIRAVAAGGVSRRDDRGRSSLEKKKKARHSTVVASSRVDLGRVEGHEPSCPRSFLLAPWLCTTAVVCLLLEVLERQRVWSRLSFGAIRPGAFFARFKRKSVAAAPRRRRRRPHQPRKPSEPVSKTEGKPSTAPTTPSVPGPRAPPRRPVTAKGDLLDAMRKVRDRSRGDGITMTASDGSGKSHGLEAAPDSQIRGPAGRVCFPARGRLSARAVGRE